MSWEGRDPPTQTRCVSLEYLNELYAKADELRELKTLVGELAEPVSDSVLEKLRAIQVARPGARQPRFTREEAEELIRRCV